MTPEDLASRHPRLFHATLPQAWPEIQVHGLLTAQQLLDRFEIQGQARNRIESTPHPAAVTFDHPDHGRAVLSDQSPMRTAALAGCLDDGLLPADWLAILNRRAFL